MRFVEVWVVRPNVVRCHDLDVVAADKACDKHKCDKHSLHLMSNAFNSLRMLYIGA